jgi:SAM-dependent methyltransferase
VAAGVVVKYADCQPVDELRKQFPDVTEIRVPDIVTDLESMGGVGNASQDFVIANHVLEHVEDPLKALKSIGRVLRPGGIAYLALPDKRFTFDKERQITPLAHLIDDHLKGPAHSLTDHYVEWCRCVDGLDGEAQVQKVSLMLAQRSNIHFHVWDFTAMSELFRYVADNPNIPLDLETSMPNGIEVIWVLRKPQASARSRQAAPRP